MAEYKAVCRTITTKSRTAVFDFLFRGWTTSPEGYYESATLKISKKMPTSLHFQNFFIKGHRYYREIPWYLPWYLKAADNMEDSNKGTYHINSGLIYETMSWNLCSTLLENFMWRAKWVEPKKGTPTEMCRQTEWLCLQWCTGSS